MPAEDRGRRTSAKARVAGSAPRCSSQRRAPAVWPCSVMVNSSAHVGRGAVARGGWDRRPQAAAPPRLPPRPPHSGSGPTPNKGAPLREGTCLR